MEPLLLRAQECVDGAAGRDVGRWRREVAMRLRQRLEFPTSATAESATCDNEEHLKEALNIVRQLCGNAM